jgi:sugar-specific transcriptional regulator TrmB
LNYSSQLKKKLIDDLELHNDEAEVFLALVKAETTSSINFKLHSKDDIEKTILICKGLEQKGMVIEINKNIFQALHPRFAIVNRYRRICIEKNIHFKKNTKIDNMGILLEKYQNTNN